MVELETKGVKISVVTRFKGTNYRNNQLYHFFSYFITIKNNSNATVQLTHRHWEIFDSLNKNEMVEGEGVVGQMPILPPQSEYSYTSGCSLESNIGSMKGFYVMKNLDNQEVFKVYVPKFQLIAPILSN